MKDRESSHTHVTQCDQLSDNFIPIFHVELNANMLLSKVRHTQTDHHRIEKAGEDPPGREGGEIASNAKRCSLLHTSLTSDGEAATMNRSMTRDK